MGIRCLTLLLLLSSVATAMGHCSLASFVLRDGPTALRSSKIDRADQDFSLC